MHKSLLQHAGSPIRPAIRDLQPNGIALVSGAALGEPDVIALWFGESDLVTPDFIREGAKRALDGGKDLLHNEGFQKHLKEYIEGLAEQGRKHNATMSVVAVASLTKQLEDLLVAHGLWAGSQYWRARQTREERRAQYWRARQTREERKARGSKPLR